MAKKQLNVNFNQSFTINQFQSINTRNYEHVSFIMEFVSILVALLTTTSIHAGVCTSSVCDLSHQYLDHNIFSCALYEVCSCHNSGVTCSNRTEASGCLYLHACFSAHIFPCCIAYDLKCLSEELATIPLQRRGTIALWKIGNLILSGKKTLADYKFYYKTNKKYVEDYLAARNHFPKEPKTIKKEQVNKVDLGIIPEKKTMLLDLVILISFLKLVQFKNKDMGLLTFGLNINLVLLKRLFHLNLKK